MKITFTTAKNRLIQCLLVDFFECQTMEQSHVIATNGPHIQTHAHSIENQMITTEQQCDATHTHFICQNQNIYIILFLEWHSKCVWCWVLCFFFCGAPSHGLCYHRIQRCLCRRFHCGIFQFISNMTYALVMQYERTLAKILWCHGLLLIASYFKFIS